MNILFINSARTWGGTEKWTRMAAESLAGRHGVRLVYRKPVVGDNIAVPGHRLPLASHVDLYSLAGIVRIIRRERIDIVIPTKRKDYVLAGIAARICGVRNILRLGIARRLRIPFFHRLMYDTLSDGIIVNAERIKNDLLHSPFMRKKNIRVIYNGLDTALINRLSMPAAPKRFAFTVTAIGTLTYRKGIDFLIRGFARFLARRPEAAAGAVIIGDGPAKQDFLDLADTLGIGERIVFAGFLKNPYPDLLSSDVFALTSTNEGISNALLEAMYLGIPPVSTKAGGSCEAVSDGKNGILVDYGDETALAEALETFYLDGNFRETVAACAAETARRDFSLDVMRDNIEHMLSEIAGVASGE